MSVAFASGLSFENSHAQRPSHSLLSLSLCALVPSFAARTLCFVIDESVITASSVVEPPSLLLHPSTPRHLSSNAPPPPPRASRFRFLTRPHSACYAEPRHAFAKSAAALRLPLPFFSSCPSFPWANITCKQALGFQRITIWLRIGTCWFVSADLYRLALLTPHSNPVLRCWMLAGFCVSYAW